jgi:hypothetical protein
MALERTRKLMNTATRDSLITDYETLIPSLELPDPNDRHILAAAIVGQCDVIVTQNLKDFPQNVLNSHEIECQHPDDFLLKHLQQLPTRFCNAIQKVRARLKNPPYNVDDYLTILTRQGLIQTVADLRQFSDLI